jgi:hypothetical protein
VQGDEVRAERRRRRTLAAGLLVPVDQGRVDIPGADPILLLRDLYPDVDRFWLPLVDIQALRTADRRFRQGMDFPVLGHKLHPWYGTYAPKRSVHLELFGTWLRQHTGPKQTAIDVGSGCGILAFMMARAGCATVHATDINPNAIESIRRELDRHDPRPPIHVHQDNLLEGFDQSADLIVFNPPWMAGAVDDPLDRALFYDDNLFERFFDQALPALSAEGRVAVVFSNVLSLLRPDLPHPIEAELARGRFQLETRLQRRVKAQRGRKTRERVEIWVLAPIDPSSAR